MNADTTLADLVTAQPAAARVLGRHHLDYCCGGQQTVHEACALAGVDVDELMSEIDGLAPAPEPDCLAEIEADTHLHVDKENNLLFPAVVELEQRFSRV